MFKRQLLTVFLFSILIFANNLNAITTEQFAEFNDQYDNGEYDKLVSSIQDILATDSSETRLLELEVRSGFFSSEPEKYISSVLESEPTGLIGELRHAITQYYCGKEKTARSELNELLKSYPDNPAINYWLGRIAIGFGKTDDALEYLRKAADNPGLRPVSLFRMGYIYQRTGRQDEADSIYTILEGLNDPRHYGSIYKAWTQYRLGNWKSALKKLDSLIEIKPIPRAFTNKMYIQRCLGRYDDAFVTAADAYKKFPNNGFTRSDMIIASDKIGRTDIVENVLGKMLPRHIAIENIGYDISNASTLHDSTALKNAVDRIMYLNYDYHYPARVYMEWLDDHNRSAESDSLLERLSQYCNSATEMRLRASRVEFDDPDKALEIFNEIIPDWPLNNYTNWIRIKWLMKAGRFSEAESRIREHIEIYPGDVDFIVYIARNYFNASNIDKAEEYLNTIDSICPGHTDAAELRYDIYQQRNELDRALIITDSLAARYPSNFQYLNDYRFIYTDEDTRGKLSAKIDHYLKIETDDIYQIRILTLALSDAHRFEEAEKILTDAIKKNPEAAELYYLRGVVYNAAGNFELSGQDYTMAQSLDPFEPQYQRGRVSTTFQGITLESYADQTKFDSIGLARITVDSILTMDKNCQLESNKYGGVILLDKQQVIYRNKYHCIRRYHRIVKMTSHEGKEEYSDFLYKFNSYRETPHLITARTILPDGKVADVEPDQVFIKSTDDYDNSDSRYISWSHPATDSGTIVEVLIQFESDYAEPFDLHYSFFANEYDPVFQYEVEFSAPTTWDLHYKNSDGFDYSTRDSSGLKIRSWSVNNVDPLVYEEDSPSSWEEGMWIRLGYKKTWLEEANWYWNRIKDKMEPNDAITDLAKEITKDAKTDEEKISAVFKYASKNIRYVAIEFGDGSIIPRPPFKVIQNNYGDCKDKATLMISMLRSLDIKACPALINSYSNSYFSKDIPDVSQFSHMIVYFPQTGKFSDPTCSYCTPYSLSTSYKGKSSLIIGSDLKDPLITTDSSTADDNICSRTMRMIPDSNGILDIYIDMGFYGESGMNMNYNLEYKDTSDIRESIKYYTGIGLWKSAKLIDYHRVDSGKTGPEYRWNAHMTVDSLFLNEYTNTFVNIWFYSLGIMFDLPDTTGRIHDLMIDPLFKVHDKYIIIPGDKWALDNNRLSWVMDTTWFKCSSQAQEWDDSVMLDIQFEMKAKRIKIDELPQFMKALDVLSKRILQQGFLFRKKADPEKIAILENAIKASPNDISLYLTLADVYLGKDNGGSRCNARENRDKALDLIRKAIEINPDNEMAFIRMISLLLVEDRSREADSLVALFEEKTGSNSPYMMIMKVATSELQCKRKKLAELIETLMTQVPSNDLRMALVSTYAKLGEFEKAKAQIDLMEVLKADSLQLMRSKYDYYIGMKDYDKVKDLIAHWPDTSKIMLVDVNTRLYQETGEFSKAYAAVADYRKDEPDNPVFLNNSAWFLAMMDSSLTEALDMVQKALTLSGECEFGTLNTRAVVYLKMGKYELAKKDLIETLSSQNVELLSVNYYFLGECALAENDKKQAIEYYTKAYELNGQRYYTELAEKKLKKLGVKLN